MEHHNFWTEVFKLRGSVTPFIMGRVLIFCVLSKLVWMINEFSGVQAGLPIAPYEIVGVVLALLLVLRTNAGYDRWYEARKLWGGIVNQSRNLAMIGAACGPRDPKWQQQFARWTAAFSHICRHSLRGERDLQDMKDLLGPQQLDTLSKAQHMPMFVAGQLAEMLRKATAGSNMDRFAFLQAERERAMLIDHIGACERILKTPLAEVFSIKIRRFLFIYLFFLPIAIVDKTGILTPLFTLLVAYPLLSLDQIGLELQNPFSKSRLGHLPLDDISGNIQNNILEYQAYAQPEMLAEKEPQPNGQHSTFRHPLFLDTPSPEIGDSIGNLGLRS